MGQVVFAYAILGQGVEETPELCTQLRNQVRKVIGPFAAPSRSSLCQACPRPAPERSCDEFCERLRAPSSTDWGTSPHSQTRLSCRPLSTRRKPPWHKHPAVI